MESAHLLIGMKVAGWAVGFLIVYAFMAIEHRQKKIRLQEVFSQLINFILFMWLSKILLNLPSFIKSPLAILAYPSNSQSFYLASFLTVALIVYNQMRKRVLAEGSLEAFMYVFLVASFMYAFMQLVWSDNSSVVYQLILVALLLVGYVILQEHLNSQVIGVLLVFFWSIGALGLHLVQPLFVVFGYTLAPWFLGVIASGSILYYGWIKRKKVL